MSEAAATAPYLTAARSPAPAPGFFHVRSASPHARERLSTERERAAGTDLSARSRERPAARPVLALLDLPS
jgi:hypothetical protein